MKHIFVQQIRKTTINILIALIKKDDHLLNHFTW